MSQSGTILRSIETALRPLVDTEGGELDVATDVAHAMEILTTGPRRFRVVLTWEGYGDHPNSRESMAQTNFLVLLHHNPGMAKDPQKSLHTQGHGSGEPSFLDLLEKISAWLRAMRFPGQSADCAGLAQTDSSWVADTPGNTRAHAMTFSMTVALPKFQNHIDTTLPS